MGAKDAGIFEICLSEVGTYEVATLEIGSLEAGFLEVSPAEGDEVTSYTIMTTEPNELMMGIHNRMPVILREDDHDRWLDLDADPADVLKPCPFRTGWRRIRSTSALETSGTTMRV